MGLHSESSLLVAVGACACVLPRWASVRTVLWNVCRAASSSSPQQIGDWVSPVVLVNPCAEVGYQLFRLGFALVCRCLGEDPVACVREHFFDLVSDWHGGAPVRVAVRRCDLCYWRPDERSIGVAKLPHSRKLAPPFLSYATVPGVPSVCKCAHDPLHKRPYTQKHTVEVPCRS